jgi:hypothetical protein
MLLFGFLAFVVAWDFVNSGPREAALTRASAYAYRWTRDEIDKRNLLERARDLLREAANAYEAASVERVARAPAVEPVFAEALPEVVAAAAASIVAPEDARSGAALAPAEDEPDSETVEVGDSVFARPAILAFIAEASLRTGVSAAYLEQLALRESSFNPVAASDHSTARGLYQFIESTWLDVFARHGAEHDQADLAALVSRSADGPTVADDVLRGRILDLRYDPKLATFLAAQHARENRVALEAALGRDVGDAELYIAHFLGLSGARTLIETHADRPGASAADLFPWAARANRRYFYDGRRERTVAELYDALLLQAGGLGGSTLAALETEAS